MIEEILKDLFKDENVNGFILSDERYKELKDYITNLQQENERLKEENILLKASEPMSKIAEDYGYKSRCEKAVDYIKMYKFDYSPYELTDSAIRNVLNILNGDENGN